MVLISSGKLFQSLQALYNAPFTKSSLHKMGIISHVYDVYRDDE